MVTRRLLLKDGAAGLAVMAGLWRWPSGAIAGVGFAVVHTDEEWRALLTAEQHAVLRRHATERPYTSPLLAEHRPGIFACAGCGQDLFSSTTKYDSHTGWPSFWAPLVDAIGTQEDRSYGMTRIEVHCSRCGGHLGHVFDDGPPPTGLRYCINGIALAFRPVVG